ncbi:MAG: malonate--CoA ligase [Marinibacterium sp.]
MANPLFDALLAPQRGRDAAFLIAPDGGTLSQDGFLRRAGQFARVLRDLGLEAGDRMAVQVEKCPDALALLAGSIQAGIVFVPLNTAYTGAEIGYFIQDSGAKLAVLAPETADAVAGTPVQTLAAGGRGSLAESADAAKTDTGITPRGPDDLAALLYTSGTTGRSKGAMLTHTNLLSNAQVLAKAWRFTADDVLLHALPIFHTHGLFVATFVTLVAGGAMIFLPKFDPDAVFSSLPDATTMMGVPTFYTRLLDDPRLTRQSTEHMRLFTSGSAPLLAETHDRFAARTGHRILERYGMTETNMTTSNPYDGERRAGTVGFPLPGVDLKITDPETGGTLPDGETGQIEVRGPNVFKGYWRMPDKTAAELREDGFFITGDLGRIDRDGYVQIVGRGKDLIISGGLNIYPKEVEQVLDAQPGVLESAVIGVPHADFGETPVGILVARPGATPDPDAIAASLDGALARFKHPRRLIVVEALPRNAMGKVQKNVLRDRYRDLFAGPAGGLTPC